MRPAGMVRQTGAMVERQVGVEEELLLVNPDTYELAAVSHRAMSAYRQARDDGAGDRAEAGGSTDELEQELFLQQLETASPPRIRLEEVRAEVRRCRQAASEAASAAGARVVAVGTPVIGRSDADTVTPKSRYERIVHGFGEIGRQGAVCAMHVHVQIESDDEGVAVLDRIRPWLPVLLAISANSPFWHGRDTGYASWRSQVWKRWPTAGPSEPFGDVAGYRAAAAALLELGAAFDAGMLYFDARLAESYPTIEIRVADVCTELDDMVLIAGLCRGLVSTAAQAWRDGVPIPQFRTDLLRAAHWRAGRDGLSHHLLDPGDARTKPARDVLDTLLAHVDDALCAHGDRELVHAAVERLLAGGAGAGRQRAILASRGSLEAVVADLAERTDASALDPRPGRSEA
jgi:glutamate---cysteine ligase / carboxylate-amine ligase